MSENDETICVKQLLPPLIEVWGVENPFCAQKTAVRPPSGGGSAVDRDESGGPDERLARLNRNGFWHCEARRQNAKLAMLNW